MASDQPLKLPGKDAEVRAWTLRQGGDGFELRDQGPMQRVAGWLLVLLIWGYLVLGGVGLALMAVGIATSRHSFGGGTAVPGTGGSGSGVPPAVSVAMVTVLTALISLLPLLLLMQVGKSLQLKRVSSVRVDTTRQLCICRRQWYGWTRGRREVELRDAEWDVVPGFIPVQSVQKASVGQGLLAIALVLAGPVGWLIAIASSLGKRGNTASRRGSELSGVEVVRLHLNDRDGTRAVVTLMDEDTAMRFLAAWDEAKG